MPAQDCCLPIEPELELLWNASTYLHNASTASACSQKWFACRGPGGGMTCSFEGPPDGHRCFVEVPECSIPTTRVSRRNWERHELSPCNKETAQTMGPRQKEAEECRSRWGCMAAGVTQNTEGSHLWQQGGNVHSITQTCTCGLRPTCAQHWAVNAKADQRDAQLHCAGHNCYDSANAEALRRASHVGAPATQCELRSHALGESHRCRPAFLREGACKQFFRPVAPTSS